MEGLQQRVSRGSNDFNYKPRTLEQSQHDQFEDERVSCQLTQSKRDMLANFAQSIVEDPNEMKISSRKSLTSSKEVYSSKDKENVVPPSKYETGMAFPPITEESGEYCGSYLSGGNKSSYKQKQVSDSMHPEQDTHGGPAQKFYSNLKLHKDGQTIAKEILSGVGCIDSNNASMSLEQLEDIVNDNVIAIKQAGKWATLEKYITVEDMATKVKKSILKKVRVVTPETLQYFDELKKKTFKSLQEALQVITKGTTLDKYCYRTIKIQKVQVAFTYDFRLLAVKPIDKDDAVMLQTSELQMVSSGLKTKRFQQYLNEDYNIDGETAFSLVFPDRTFDLVAANVEERDRFVMAIKFIKSCL